MSLRRPYRGTAALGALLQWSALTASAQQNLVAPEPGEQASPEPSLLRPYVRPVIPPIRLRLMNSSRAHGLIRAGVLYLSVSDALALAIENNLDLEIERYGPLAADWNLQRQQGGGPLRGASANASQVGAVASGQGVLGSESSVGLLAPTGGTGGGGAGSNSSVQQVGITAPNYDPTLSSSVTFSHVSIPQYNQAISEIPTLVDDTRTYQTQIQEGLETGGFVRFSQTEDYLNENSPGDSINPSMAPNLSLLAYQPLLQGLGVRVNTYYIHVAQNNVQAQRESFRSQMLDLAANVLNLYWDLVSAEDSVRAAQQSLEIAQKFDDDTRQRIRLGTLANYQSARADAELARNQQSLALAQLDQQQSEQTLKNVISRVEDAELETAQIVTTDRIDIPETDDLLPLRELVAKALAGRPDLAVAQINDENQEITSVGTRNNLLPTGYMFARATNTGDSGSLASGLGQVFRRDFPPAVRGRILLDSAQQPRGAKRLRHRPVAVAAEQARHAAHAQ